MTLQILANGPQAQLEETKLKLGIEGNNLKTITLSSSQILVPGLVDTHIHAVQFPNIGLGYDVTLIEWLEKYTYKLEKQFKNQQFSKTIFDALVVRM